VTAILDAGLEHVGVMNINGRRRVLVLAARLRHFLGREVADVQGAVTAMDKTRLN